MMHHSISSLVYILSLLGPLCIFSQLTLDRACETDQYEGGIVGSGMYQAKETLRSDGSIASNSDVIFSADEVSLSTSFTVPVGSTFLAENTDCESVLADVTATSVSGSAGAYTFSVTIENPDTGCSQYANWWEVISLDGTLLYRRVLGHSHVNEQPFTRSGGPVNISSTDEVYVRAWMHPTGYGGQVMKGSVAMGFEKTVLSKEFASELSQEAPLPGNCPF